MDVVCGVWKIAQTVCIFKKLDTPQEVGHWEFPGGKVQPGETLEQALKREWHEELGVQIEIIQKLKPVTITHAVEKLILHPFIIDVKYPGDLQLTEHSQMHKIDCKALLTYNLWPADLQIAQQLNDIFFTREGAGGPDRMEG